MRINRQSIRQAQRASAVVVTWSVLATMVTFSSAQAFEDIDDLGSPGTIEIHVDAVPDSDQRFTFGIDGGLSPSSVDLDDDGDIGLYPSTYEWTGVGPGSYFVEAAFVDGWDIVGECDDPTGNSTGGSNLVTVELDSEEAVVCTFTARPTTGTIVIVNDTVPDSSQDFSYSVDGGLTPSPFSLDDDTDPTLSNTQIFANIEPGSHTVTQGFSLLDNSVSCIDPDDGTTTSAVGSARAFIDLDAGETVTCTFTNEPPAMGAFVLDVDIEPSSETFEVVLDSVIELVLEDGESVEVGAVGLGPVLLDFETRDGWQTLVECTDPDGGTPASSPGGEITLDIDPGEIIACAVTYRIVRVEPQPPPPATGTITVIQDTVPDSAQDFAFGVSGGLTPADFSLDDDADPTLPRSITFLDAAAGTYRIEQTPVAGWTTRARCVDDGGRVTSGASSANVELDADETITCTFTSTKDSTITIVKDAQPNDPQDFRFSSTLDFPFFLDDDDDPTLPNSRTYTVPPGQWIVTEKATDGWTVRVECSDPDGGTEVRGSTATIDLDLGEDITCTYINSKIGEPPAPGTIVITKRTLPAGSDRQFTITGADGLGSVMLRDGESATFTDLEPGSYTFNETLLDDFTVDDITCADPDNGSVSDPTSGEATVDLDAGETVTCTFTNELTPPPPPPPPPPPCVDINQRLRAPGWTPTQTTMVTTSIAAGSYSIEVSATDGHHRAGFQTDQVEEQFVIDLYDPSGALVYTTAPNTDLADDATGLTEIVNSNVDLPEIGSLRARHVGSGATPDSIDVLCVRFIPT